MLKLMLSSYRLVLITKSLRIIIFEVHFNKPPIKSNTGILKRFSELKQFNFKLKKERKVRSQQQLLKLCEKKTLQKSKVACIDTACIYILIKLSMTFLSTF